MLPKIQAKLEKLLQLSEDVGIDISDMSDLAIRERALAEAIDRSEQKKLLVHVVGTMKSGKSTFINALLGQDVLPNESAACTLVPVYLRYHANKNAKLVKVCGDSSIEQMDGKNVGELFLTDVRKQRAQLEAGNDIQLQSYALYSAMPLLSAMDSSAEISMIDTPGMNETTEFTDRLDFRKQFVNSVLASSMLLFVIDIQNYQDEENLRLLEQIREYRPDLTNQIIFVLNKIDRFDSNKGVSLTEGISKVRSVLAERGFENNEMFPLSSKKGLLSRMVAQEVRESKGFFYRLKRMFVKRLTVAENYMEDFNQVLPLLEERIDGKLLTYKPDPAQYYEEMWQESGVECLEQYLDRLLHQDLDILYSNMNQAIVDSTMGWLNEIVRSYTFRIDEDLTKIDDTPLRSEVLELEGYIQTLEKYAETEVVEKLLKDIDYSQITNTIINSNANNNAFARSNLPSYATGWKEYRDDDFKMDESSSQAGFDKKELQNYYYRVAKDAANEAGEEAIKQLKLEIKKLNLNIAEKETELTQLLVKYYADLNLSIHPALPKLSSLSANRIFTPDILKAPYLNIESKTKYVERWVFKGLGDKRFISYRLGDVGEFREDCTRLVNQIYQNAAKFVCDSLNLAVREQLLPVIMQQLEQPVILFSDRKEQLNEQLNLQQELRDKKLRTREQLTSL